MSQSRSVLFFLDKRVRAAEAVPRSNPLKARVPMVKSVAVTGDWEISKFCSVLGPVYQYNAPIISAQLSETA